MPKTTIVSPLPGTFYHRPAPDEPPYKDVQDKVTEGEVIGLIEVMKSFHEVKATATGKISAFLAENEEAVQAGQALVELDE